LTCPVHVHKEAGRIDAARPGAFVTDDLEHRRQAAISPRVKALRGMAPDYRAGNRPSYRGGRRRQRLSVSVVHRSNAAIPGSPGPNSRIRPYAAVNGRLRRFRKQTLRKVTHWRFSVTESCAQYVSRFPAMVSRMCEKPQRLVDRLIVQGYPSESLWWALIGKGIKNGRSRGSSPGGRNPTPQRRGQPEHRRPILNHVPSSTFSAARFGNRVRVAAVLDSADKYP
jgi:hypothetical protein